jgi:hypothetical protein
MIDFVLNFTTILFSIYKIKESVKKVLKKSSYIFCELLTILNMAENIKYCNLFSHVQINKNHIYNLIIYPIFF